MDRLEIPQFKSQKKLFKFLATNEDKLIAQKKAIFKQADGFAFSPMPALKGYGVSKAAAAVGNESTKELLVKAIINTTNYLDSHGDVHLRGIWDKSISENKNNFHVQEHNIYKFDHIISDGQDLEVYVKDYSWKDLGFNYDGITQALEYASIVKKTRNQYMFGQYQNGYVKNHSVGMRYVKMVLCINDEETGDAYYEAYQKYISDIVNKDLADERGWFWAIKEAKHIEGSAVPLGSNSITPTQSVEAAKALLQLEAANALQKRQKSYFMNL